MRLDALRVFLNEQYFLQPTDDVGLVGSNLIIGRGDDVIASLDVRTGDVTYRMPEVKKSNEVFLTMRKGIE
jgi:hypothetical protein